MSEAKTQYVVVRRDLPAGVIATWVAHAAGEGSERHPPGTYVVILQVGDEAELMATSKRLVAGEVGHTVMRETAGTYEGQALSIGLELISDRSRVKRCLSHLPLLRW